MALEGWYPQRAQRFKGLEETPMTRQYVREECPPLNPDQK